MKLIQFGELSVNQSFLWQGHVYVRVGRARDRDGAYNAVRMSDKARRLFAGKDLVQR